jgi:hypothetical protein
MEEMRTGVRVNNDWHSFSKTSLGIVVQLSNKRLMACIYSPASEAFCIPICSNPPCLRYGLASSRAEELGVIWLPFPRPMIKGNEVVTFRRRENRWDGTCHYLRIPT